MEKQDPARDHKDVPSDHLGVPGTETPIKGDEADKRKEQSARRENKPQDLPEQKSKANLYLFFTGLIAVATTIYAIVASVQLWTMNKTLGEMRKSNEIARIPHGAIVKVRVTQTTPADDNGSGGIATVIVHNSGPVSTKAVIEAAATVGSFRSLRVQAGSDVQGTSFMVDPGTDALLQVMIPPLDRQLMARLRSGTDRSIKPDTEELWITGRAYCEDALGNTRTHYFCWVVISRRGWEDCYEKTTDR